MPLTSVSLSIWFVIMIKVCSFWSDSPSAMEVEVYRSLHSFHSCHTYFTFTHATHNTLALFQDCELARTIMYDYEFLNWGEETCITDDTVLMVLSNKKPPKRFNFHIVMDLHFCCCWPQEGKSKSLNELKIITKNVFIITSLNVVQLLIMKIKFKYVHYYSKHLP